MQSQLTIYLITMSTFCGLCSAQAPGDESSRCTTGSSATSHPDNVKILMDSWNYENLLVGTGSGFSPVRNPVWRDASCDDNDITSATTPTYWQHGSGGLCRFQVQVCGHSQGDQDNWLFTQHISKAVPAADTYNVRVYVNITFNFRSCFERLNCNPRFKLNRYFVNTQPNASTCSNKTLYSDGGIMPDNVFGPEANNLQVTYQRYFNLNTNRDGFYLALQDYSMDTADHHLRGTCVRVYRFVVFRYECKEKLVGLVRYPGTQAPVSGTRSVTTQCVDNARSVSSLSVTCNSTGFWDNQSPQCECDVGYIENSGSCQGCGAGTYSSSGSCVTCPSNTVTTEVATGQCACERGYFRNTIISDSNCNNLSSTANENAASGCTAPPSSPQSVVLTAPSATQVRVTWSSPAQTGDRNDLYYMVEHSDPDSLGDFTGTTCKSSSATSHTFSSLRAGTAYCVRVSAHNGVSDQDPDNAATRYVEECTNTPESVPGQVFSDGIIGSYPIVVWSHPEQPNGVITNYRLIFRRGGSSTRIETNSDQTYYVIQSGDLPGTSGDFTVEIRAENGAGYGTTSSRVTISPPDPSDSGCNTCCSPCAECDSCCPDPPTSTPCPTCPDPTTCPPTSPPCPDCDTCCPDCPTVPCGSCDSCCPTPTDPTPPPITRPGMAQDVVALGCGIVGWKQPNNTGGEIATYIVRFYDGATAQSGSYLDLQRDIDPKQTWAVARNLPSIRPIYVEIRIRNSAGSSDFTQRIIVANDTLCPTTTDPTCPTPEPCSTCPPPDPCHDCDSCCPTSTCPDCDSCCENCTDTVFPTTDLPITRPGVAEDVVSLGCGALGWKKPSNIPEIIGYDIRFFDGDSYEASVDGYRESYTADPDQTWAKAWFYPSTKPIYADVRVRNSAGASEYSERVLVAMPPQNCSESVFTTGVSPLDIAELKGGFFHIAWNPVACASSYSLTFYDANNKITQTDETTVPYFPIPIDKETDDVYVMINPKFDDIVNKTLQTDDSNPDPVKIDIAATLEELRNDPDIGFVCSGLQSSESDSSSISGTPIAIAIIVTFLITLVAVVFLAVVVGLVMHSWLNKKRENKMHTNGYSHSSTTQDKSRL